MSYKLYTDKQETFECKIHLEGASLKTATSRILVETDDVKLMFEGTIDKDGVTPLFCKVSVILLTGLNGCLTSVIFIFGFPLIHSSFSTLP